MNAMRHIRKDIFRVSQTGFAKIIGVNQASISRWENGVAPSLEDMRAIRKAAARHGIPWDDRWFFDLEDSAA